MGDIISACLYLWFTRSLRFWDVLERAREYRQVCRLVDRRDEICRLVDLLTGSSAFVQVLYGPRGCGKSFLLNAFTYGVSKQSHVLSSILCEEPESLSRLRSALSMREDLRDLFDMVCSIAAGGSPLLSVLSKLLDKISSLLQKYGYEYVLVVVDEVRGEEAKRVVEHLYNFINDLLGQGYRVCSIVSTSYGSVVGELLKTRKVRVSVVWNLGLDGVRDLLGELGSDLDPESVYLVTGGNPREIIKWVYEYRGSFSQYLDDVLGLVTSVIQKLSVLCSERGIDEGDLLRRLIQVVEDPDILQGMDPSISLIRQVLIEDSLVVPFLVQDFLGVTPPKDMPGIGQYFAWTTPLFAEAVKVFIENDGRLDVVKRELLAKHSK